jgi:3-deoxy-7-phosphoheptulonate synthase
LRAAALSAKEAAMAETWSPTSWRGRDARQQPAYADAAALAAAVRSLAGYPPLVAAAEAAALGRDLADAQAGRAFLLQGGDCAESFALFSAEGVAGTVALLGGLANRLEQAGGRRVIRVGRIAGQFAKPRTRLEEVQGGRALPMYRGDIVNDMAFEPAARAPDPERMFHAYAQAAATLVQLRGLAGERPFYTSHEALLLPFEEALVRRDGAGWYGSSGHFLWIGDRTRFPGSAHVELLRGLANPIGIKCGPSLEPAGLLALLDRLNPARIEGRVTLIARMGSGRIAAALPPLLRAAAREGHPVLWACDPMHGNTELAAGGYKTRRLEAIVAEARAFFALMRAEGLRPGGLHLEMAAGEVTECTGAGIAEADLPRRYETRCDPRLNPRQARAVVDAVAAELAADLAAEAA